VAATLTELAWVKEHGACGVYVRGTEHDRILSDPYFFPMYQKAAELDLPICVHVGNSLHNLNQVIEEETIIFDVVPVPASMFSLIAGRIPERFPGLRFGFLEAGSSWLPFILQEAHRGPSIGGRRFSHHENLLRDSRFFVACQTDDDLTYLLQYGAARNLVFGTDYGHVDVGTDLEGHRILTEREDLDGEVAGAIVNSNARTLYGL
jgi:predicted TIM-barrel fold metal-dependent hydrolase